MATFILILVALWIAIMLLILAAGRGWNRVKVRTGRPNRVGEFRRFIKAIGSAEKPQDGAR